MRGVFTTAVLAMLPFGLAAAVAPPPQRAALGRGGADGITTDVECAASLGTGVESRRTFCDVLIGTHPKDSIAMTIPPHAGAAMLQFDLHNRFAVPAVRTQSALTFMHDEAVMAVVRSDGSVIARAAVARDFRTPRDLFDRLSGGGRPGGVKAVAPGLPEPIRVTVPAGVSTVGLVGTSLRVWRSGSDQTFDAPGRPIAIVSNARIDFRAR
jgi:hypothetical protein